MNRKRSSVLGSTFPRSIVDRPSGALLLATLFALVAFALGCDSGTQEPAAPAPEMPEATAGVDDATGSESAPAAPAAPVAREGEIDPSRFPTDLPEGVTAAVPDNFPSDIPLYPGAQAAQGKGVEMEGSPQSAVQLVSNDALADVHKFYSDELAAKGWTFEQDTETEVGATIKATKGDCQTHIMIMPAPGGGSDIYIVTGC
jgi:hypothetical protein